MKPLPSPIREDSRGLPEPSVNDRINTLAAQGLRVRDISSIMSVHPLIVQRALGMRTQCERNASNAETLRNRYETVSQPSIDNDSMIVWIPIGVRT